MNWGDAGTFFRMGGYGLYVWGAYAMTAALMLAEPLLTMRRRRLALLQADDAAPDPLETDSP